MDIIPKQTDVYKLSAPMLFNFDAIDSYVEYNKKYKKSQVKVLFQAIPWPLAKKFNEWFMPNRFGVQNPSIKTYADFDKYAQYAMERGFEIIYLLNSPKAFNDIDLEAFREDFYELLDNLWASGIRRLKFGNTQVAQLINEYNPNFQLSLAVTIEYEAIAQFRSLLKYFPNINHVCVPKDLNQNFHLLANLKKEFPDVEFELMVNEACPKWCPSRLSCSASSYSDHYKIGCRIARQDDLLSRCRCGAIHPWQLEYYSALGFNHFKVLTQKSRTTSKSTADIENYMQNIEYGTNGEHGRNYLERYCFDLAYLAKPEECMALLPNIEYFIKNGDKCAYDCCVNCTYCYDCAEKIKQLTDERI